jgi:hypothetical protein
LRQLALLSPAERRQKLGAVGTPVNARGAVIPVNRGVSPGDDRPDDGPEAAKPGNPRLYEVPAPNPLPAASYAKPQKPNKSLDTGEGIGRGTPPPGGAKVC